MWSDVCCRVESSDSCILIRMPHVSPEGTNHTPRRYRVWRWLDMIISPFKSCYTLLMWLKSAKIQLLRTKKYPGGCWCDLRTWTRLCIKDFHWYRSRHHVSIGWAGGKEPSHERPQHLWDTCECDLCNAIGPKTLQKSCKGSFIL